MCIRPDRIAHGRFKILKRDISILLSYLCAQSAELRRDGSLFGCYIRILVFGGLSSRVSLGGFSVTYIIGLWRIDTLSDILTVGAAIGFRRGAILPGGGVIIAAPL